MSCRGGVCHVRGGVYHGGVGGSWKGGVGHVGVDYSGVNGENNRCYSYLSLDLE